MEEELFSLYNDEIGPVIKKYERCARLMVKVVHKLNDKLLQYDNETLTAAANNRMTMIANYLTEELEEM